MMTVAADGTPYLPPGLGQMSNGTNVRVAMRADWIATQVHDFEMLCRRLADGIILEATKLGAEAPDRVLALRLVTFGRRFVAEERSGLFGLSFIDKESLTVAVKNDATSGISTRPSTG
jgi:hypothetical protein